MEDDPLARFIEAADNLVNLLATKPQPRPLAVRQRRHALDRAYNEYDAARAALVGEPTDQVGSGGHYPIEDASA